MKKIKVILVPTDFSKPADNAFNYANALATKLGAKVKVLNVYSDNFLQPTPHVLRNTLMAERKDLAQRKLWRYVHPNPPDLPEKGDVEVLPTVDIDPHLMAGDPADSIIRLIEGGEADMVVMGTKGEHNVKEKVLGSVSSKVVRDAKCPVLVIPPDYKFQEPKHIAYASDLSDADLQDMQQLILWAGKFNSTLHWVHVVTDPKSKEVVRKGEEFEQILQINAPALEVGFTTLEARNIDEGLNSFLEEKDIDMLVMHPHKHRLFEGLFRKSATKKMLFQSQIPLLAFHD